MRVSWNSDRSRKPVIQIVSDLFQHRAAVAVGALLPRVEEVDPGAVAAVVCFLQSDQEIVLIKDKRGRDGAPAQG